MGIFGDSSEENNVKTIDTNGQVNNNIIIREADDIHEQLKLNQTAVTLMYVTCVVQLLKFGMYIYCKFVGKMKKKYSSDQGQN